MEVKVEVEVKAEVEVEVEIQVRTHVPTPVATQFRIRSDERRERLRELRGIFDLRFPIDDWRTASRFQILDSRLQIGEPEPWRSWRAWRFTSLLDCRTADGGSRVARYELRVPGQHTTRIW